MPRHLTCLTSSFNYSTTPLLLLEEINHSTSSQSHRNSCRKPLAVYLLGLENTVLKKALCHCSQDGGEKQISYGNPAGEFLSIFSCSISSGSGSQWMYQPVEAPCPSNLPIWSSRKNLINLESMRRKNVGRILEPFHSVHVQARGPLLEAYQ